MINLFPYTDAHELNLDWIVEQVKANDTKVKDLTNTIINMHFDFDSKADKATTYTKTEVNTLLLGKANVSDLPDMSNYYTKVEVDNLLPDMSDYYDSTTIDNMFNNLTLPFSSITSTPGTLAGYGINNAYTQNEVNMMVSSLQTQIDQKEVLTETISIIIPSGQTGRSVTSDVIFDANYKLISLDPIYTNDLWFFTENKTPTFSFSPSSRKIIVSVKEAAVGDSVTRTLDFNVSYKRA